MIYYALMKRWFSISSRYRMVAFISGFSLMVFELAGSRILSPVIGSSTYVWTSVIGVIIAALSLGYFMGGQLADSRHKTSDILWLLIICAGCMVITLLLYDSLLSWLISSKLDVRLQAIAASLVLFAPASLVLGAISPYLAKLHTTSLGTTGRSIALLSALNSLGGITGTFLAGFVFFGYIGSRQTLLLLIALLLLTSFLTLEKPSFRKQIRSSLIIIATGSLLLAASANQAGVLATIETPTASYQVKDVTYNGEAVRVLTMGPGGYQSGIFLDGRQELPFNYAREMARGVELYGPAKSILIIGGGSFTLPQYLAQLYPETLVDVVEIDPKLESIAKQYFDYQAPKNVRIITEDGRRYVNQATDRYDVVLTDAFSDTGIPFTLTTREFASEIKRLLRPSGVVINNVIASENKGCRDLLGGINSSFKNSFGSGRIKSLSSTSLQRRQNILLSYAANNPAWLTSFGGQTETSATDVLLTDERAPIERFHHSCLNS